MFYQNNQIHNNLYLTVENSIEIGKVNQVTEKWVFFKLLFQILQTDWVRITIRTWTISLSLSLSFTLTHT